MSLLADILETKRREVALLRKQPYAQPRREPIDVAAALRRHAGAPLRIIAEVKLQSPSAGSLSRALTPAERVLAYAQAGASMISVLCDGAFFGGSWEDLAQARAALDTANAGHPLLAKEFIIDESQILQARGCGADAVLLIARIVSDERLGQLSAYARSLRLEPIVEVVEERELASAHAARAHVIGVNARDLDTLQMDSKGASRLLSSVPEELVSVHFSGVRGPTDVARIARSRADAVLIGEALMRDDDPRPLLQAMALAAQGTPTE